MNRCSECGAMIPDDQMTLHLKGYCGGLEDLEIHLKDMIAFGGKGSDAYREMMGIYRKHMDKKKWTSETNKKEKIE